MKNLWNKLRQAFSGEWVETEAEQPVADDAVAERALTVSERVVAVCEAVEDGAEDEAEACGALFSADVPASDEANASEEDPEAARRLRRKQAVQQAMARREARREREAERQAVVRQVMENLRELAAKLDDETRRAADRAHSNHLIAAQEKLNRATASLSRLEFHAEEQEERLRVLRLEVGEGLEGLHAAQGESRDRLLSNRRHFQGEIRRQQHTSGRRLFLATAAACAVMLGAIVSVFYGMNWRMDAVETSLQSLPQSSLPQPSLQKLQAERDAALERAAVAEARVEAIVQRFQEIKQALAEGRQLLQEARDVEEGAEPAAEAPAEAPPAETDNEIALR